MRARPHSDKQRRRKRASKPIASIHKQGQRWVISRTDASAREESTAEARQGRLSSLSVAALLPIYSIHMAQKLLDCLADDRGAQPACRRVNRFTPFGWLALDT